MDVGSWLLKCKQRGVVMHNSDLVLDGLVHIDAELQFKALSHFSTSLNGVLTFEDSLSKGVISKSGDIRPIRTLYHALSNLKGDDIAAMDDDDGVDRGSVMSDSGDSDSGDSEGEREGEGFSGGFGVGAGAGADFPSSSGAGSATSSPARNPSHARRARRTPGNYTPGGENGGTGTSVGAGAGSPAVLYSRDRLIKAGWLYKQGDLLRRWRCRYFKVTCMPSHSSHSSRNHSFIMLLVLTPPSLFWRFRFSLLTLYSLFLAPSRCIPCEWSISRTSTTLSLAACICSRARTSDPRASAR